MKKLLIAIAVLSSLACGAIAQEGAMPIPPEMSNISWMLGEWKGKNKFYFGGDSSETTGTMSTKMAMGGRYMMSSNTMEIFGAKHEGLHLLTYDPTAKKWRGNWFDSAGSDTMEMFGEADGDKIVLVSTPTAMQGSSAKVVMRSTYTRKSDTTVEFLLEMQVGAEWTKMIEGTYTKAAQEVAK